MPIHSSDEAPLHQGLNALVMRDEVLIDGPAPPYQTKVTRAVHNRRARGVPERVAVTVLHEGEWAPAAVKDSHFAMKVPSPPRSRQ